MIRIKMIVCALVAAAFALSCASADRMTVEQYAKVCADGIASAQTLIDPQSLTWGELASLATRSADVLRELNPPSELSRFHRASRQTFEFVAEVAGDHPPSELANPLAFGLEAIQIATQLRRAVADLSVETRQTLSQTGCL